MGKYYTDEFLLSELVRFFQANGRIPKARELNNKNGYPNWISYRYRFGSLREALERSGLPLKGFRIRPKSYSSVDLIKLLIAYKKQYDRFPEYSDLNKRGDAVLYPHVRTYETRFGSFQVALDLAITIDADDSHSNLTMASLVEEVEKTHRSKRFDIDKTYSIATDKTKLTLLEINHMIATLENVYCHTCINLKNKLIEIRKELLGHGKENSE